MKRIFKTACLILLCMTMLMSSILPVSAASYSAKGTQMLKEGKVSVKVMGTTEKWYGVTYKEDKQAVVEAIKEKIADGLYPEKLW